MRKAINNTLKALTITAVIVSTLLTFIAYCTQYSNKEKTDLKSRTKILEQCLNDFDEGIALDTLHRMYDDTADIRVTLIRQDGTVVYDNEADTAGGGKKT